MTRSLRSAGHEVHALTRKKPAAAGELQWNGRSEDTWCSILDDMDAVVNATGYGLQHWPWTRARRREFAESRIRPGRVLVSSITKSRRPPRVFVQFSGINHYGSRGATTADESTPPADDYLAQLTVEWEAATAAVERVGVRRIVARNAIVLDSHRGLLPLMALPVRLFVGGRLGNGTQAVPWIHLADHVAAIRFLIENERAAGIYNLVAPTSTSNEELMRAIARALGRPFWLRVPAFLLHTALGEMSGLVLEGRHARPKRLLDLGYRFAFPTIDLAMQDLFGKK